LQDLQEPKQKGAHTVANERPEDLTVQERFRFERLIGYLFASFELALEYHRDGLLSGEGIEVHTQSVLPLFESSAVAEWWEREGEFTYSREFRDLVSDRRAASVR
jgi:hypothetical protein